MAGQKCTVLGAGGAGAAAAYALQAAGGIVTIINRTPEKARKVAALTGCSWGDYSLLEKAVRESKILVHTLLAGVDVVDATWLSAGQIVLDALYHHSMVREKAIERGCFYLGGEEWLISQGIAGYREFTGLEPDIKGMRTGLKEQTPPRHIILTGFMGTGKSSCGPLLAEKLGYAFIDTDQQLEEYTGMSIPALISLRGEDYFRKTEREITEKCLASETPLVIACGGGTLLDEDFGKQLSRDCLIIWLYASPSICVQRIGTDGRPLLDRYIDRLEGAEMLFKQRKFAYARVAHLLVSTANRTPKEVSNKIYGEINQTWPD